MKETPSISTTTLNSILAAYLQLETRMEFEKGVSGDSEDVLSLLRLADKVHTGFCQRLPFSTPDLPSFPVSDVDLPYDTRVIAELQDRRRWRSRDC